MHAVLLTLQLPEECSEAEDALRQHGLDLHDWPGVVAVTALRDGIQCGFFLLFRDTERADSYLQSREVKRIPTLPGCTDVYIHRFSTFDLAGPETDFSGTGVDHMESTGMSYVS